MKRNLRDDQIANLESVLRCAEEFCRDAGTDFSHSPVGTNTVVLESGHQPNFLPHSGLLKKLYLLEFMSARLGRQGISALPIFGFADYNLATSRIIAQNKLPALNKPGYEKVGFKISGDDVWKRLTYIGKPDAARWKAELDKITGHYVKYPIPDETILAEVIEILEESYAHAKNFPDINAFFISKLSARLGLSIRFFRYSDLQEGGVFLDEWKKVFAGLGAYNITYNRAVSKCAPDIQTRPDDHVPFWYHCPCGAKVSLSIEDGHCRGRCALCSREHMIDIGELDWEIKSMSPNAISRNVIFGEGLGTHIFISGSGGGLTYGRVADEIAAAFGFNVPETIAWKSRDYYTGPAHRAAQRLLASVCGVQEKQLLECNIARLVEERKNELAQASAQAADKKEAKKFDGQYRNLISTAAIIRDVYGTVPSFVDILVTFGFKRTRAAWDDALAGYGGEKIISKDIVYENADTTGLYKNIEKMVLHD
ncbi:MAG TPA: hypothetical protein HA257_04560 [Candidatus Methanoperedenaceae archaeon]|nr:hypothetical protein [Candidatus Methanoperedenaceae archaeon]